MIVVVFALTIMFATVALAGGLLAWAIAAGER